MQNWRNTVRLFIFGRSRHNAHWIFSTLLTEIKIVWSTLRYNRALLTVLHPPSPAMQLQSTPPLLLGLLLLTRQVHTYRNETRNDPFWYSHLYTVISSHGSRHPRRGISSWRGAAAVTTLLHPPAKVIYL
jgi:hypothetical protein